MITGVLNTFIDDLAGGVRKDYVLGNIDAIKDIIDNKYNNDDNKYNNDEIKYDLEQKKVILKVSCASDITPAEKADGLEEFIIIMELEFTDRANAGNINYFKNTMLKSLIDNEKIRTIEYVKKESIHPFEGAYILHLVGGLPDVGETIVERIHGLSANHKYIKCTTRVVTPIEYLSDAKCPVLYETTIIDREQQEDVLDIIGNYTSYNYPHPFIIKELKREKIVEIINFFKECKKRQQNDRSMSAENEEIQESEWLRGLVSFIYGICTSLKNDKIIDEGLFDRNIKHYCISTVTDIGMKIEKTLSVELNSVTPNRPSTGTTNMGELIKEAIAYYKDKKEVGPVNTANKWDEETLFCLKKKLNFFAEKRNNFSHAYEEKYFKNKKVSQYADELLKHTNTALQFLIHFDDRKKTE
ncbi:MAG: hypothetical protein HQK96_20700 [Nitrospirae bacterium]|uniref:hypothetical protein n=1 Tax=Candidatus Magnetominusculus dajiuhuensis TaxID=3137712 RepID=UPI0019ED14BA|nr:hypothetical protein [Nitrospirota bacterium]